MADPDKEEQEFKEVFDSFDKNGDGTICTTELGAALTKIIGAKPAADDLRNMMKKIDANGSGCIDFREFMKLMKNTASMCEARELFEEKDKDGNGLITAEELREVMNGRSSAEKIDEMIKMCDVSDDNKLSYAEFLTSMAVRYI